MEKTEIINEIMGKGLYDFISANYWKLDKEIMKTIIQELDYAIHTNMKGMHDNKIYTDFDVILNSKVINIKNNVVMLSCSWEYIERFLDTCSGNILASEFDKIFIR